MRRIIGGSLCNTALRAAVFLVIAGKSASATMVITGNFTTNFNNFFGINASAAQAAWNAAAGVFTSNFSDNIHINITVDAVSGTSIFGQSNAASDQFIGDYAAARLLLQTDSTTPDDATALSGSVPVTDPTGGTGTFFAPRAQAKAIGLIASDSSNDGTTTFGAGFNWSFTGSASGAQFDFEGVAAHEISEIMGRVGFKGGSGSQFSILDLFSFTGAATRSMVNGDGASFSIDDGTTLLKAFNLNTVNGLDSRDWASGCATGSGGDLTPNSFNQCSSNGVANIVNVLDLREMDVIGYDRIVAPEPSAGLMVISALVLGSVIRRRTRV